MERRGRLAEWMPDDDFFTEYVPGCRQVFDPRYAVELTATGTLNVAPSTAMPRMPRNQRPSQASAEGPTYVFRCATCGKTFNKKKMDGTLNAHKNKQGYPC